MDKRTALFFIIVLALLVLPGLAGEIPESALREVAGFGLAAYVVALTCAIFGAFDRILNGANRRERKEP